MTGILVAISAVILALYAYLFLWGGHMTGRPGEMIGKLVVATGAILVLGICTYTFLAGTKLLEGQFENDLFAWYFLAKGIFCSLSLVLTHSLLEAVRGLRK